MARNPTITVEVSSSGNFATFHFRSDNPLGDTGQTLKRSGYRTDANYLRFLSDDDGKNLVTELFAIPGITEVAVHQYEVGVFIGKAYGFEEIIPKVAALLGVLFYCHEDETIAVNIEHVGHAPPRPALELRTGIEARMDIERIMHWK